jgi:hypothetical protein
MAAEWMTMGDWLIGLFQKLKQIVSHSFASSQETFP